jgi:Camelysin metallo-endopeptidase
VKSNANARSRAAKIVGSLGIIGTAAAVAGIGTFGGFTDSTTPVATNVSTGTLKIDLSQPGFAIPASTTGFVPGDSLTRPVNLVNSGTVGLGSVTLGTTVGTASVLTTDTVNGLQMAVKSCAVPWTQAGTASAATYTCSSGERLLASGPAVGNMALSNPTSLTAGGTDYLTFSISLPTTADNTFQGKSAALSLTFTATQKTGSAR